MQGLEHQDKSNWPCPQEAYDLISEMSSVYQGNS